MFFMFNPLALIARLLYRLYHKPLTDSEVQEYYKGLNSAHALQMKLSIDSVKWHGELFLFDWDKTPNESLSLRSINCNDFTQLYIHLFKKLNIPYKLIYMTTFGFDTWEHFSNPQWHSITMFVEDGKILYQSNNAVLEIKSLNELLDYCRAKGYTCIKIQDESGEL